MLMRNTSTPESTSRSIVSGAEEAGPSVATILTLRCRLIGSAPLRRALLGVGEADRPLLRLARVHLEEARALVPPLRAVLDTPDRERPVLRAHEVGADALAPAIVVHR